MGKVLKNQMGIETWQLIIVFGNSECYPYIINMKVFYDMVVHWWMWKYIKTREVTLQCVAVEASKSNMMDQITANNVPNAGNDITTYPNRAKDTEINVFLSDMLTEVKTDLVWLISKDARLFRRKE